MKLFFALTFDEASCQRIAAMQNRLSKCSCGYKQPCLVRKEHYHLTLVYLGAQSAKALTDLIHIIDRVDLWPFRLQAKDLCFLGQGAQKLACLTFKDQPALLLLQKQLHMDLQEKYLWPQKDRPFWPHVTLARNLYFSRPDPRKVPDLSFITRAATQLLAKDLVLYESLEKNGQIIYHKHHSRPLG